MECGVLNVCYIIQDFQMFFFWIVWELACAWHDRCLEEVGFWNSMKNNIFLTVRLCVFFWTPTRCYFWTGWWCFAFFASSPSVIPRFPTGWRPYADGQMAFFRSGVCPAQCLFFPLFSLRLLWMPLTLSTFSCRTECNAGLNKCHR